VINRCYYLLNKGLKMKKLFILGLIFLGSLSYGGCKINLLYKNVSDQDITIYKSKETAVKSKGGSWKSLGSKWSGFFHVVDLGAKLALNDTMGATYNATFRCNAKRRYRITYSCLNGNSFTKYYPSSDRWTKNQTVKINVGQLCDEVQKNNQTFRHPTVNTRRVDWCKTWGQGCGEPAATYFCTQKGFVRASKWEEDKDIGNTLVLGDNKVCTPSGCDGFKSITCVK
jgi:hypothetical protein